MKDIFEDLKKEGKCNFVSDLRYNADPSLAKQAIGRLTLEDYDLSQISELASYIYSEDVKFSDIEEAKLYFSGK